MIGSYPCCDASCYMQEDLNPQEEPTSGEVSPENNDINTEEEPSNEDFNTLHLILLPYSSTLQYKSRFRFELVD